MTHLVSSLSQELEVSEPTVRRTVQLLRELGLVTCGNQFSKGRVVRVTRLGSAVLEPNGFGGDALKH
jgi:Mn-dependent DtxR family transcriptional regulator